MKNVNPILLSGLICLISLFLRKEAFCQIPGFHVDATHSVLFGDSLGGPGAKFMWLPEKRAFRAGRVDSLNAVNNGSTFWDIDSIGLFSVAFGSNNRAIGTYSYSSGSNNNSRGFSSKTWGNFNKALDNFTSAWGRSNVANGMQATVWGLGNKALSTNATAWGSGNLVTQRMATAWGAGNSALGGGTTAWGNGNIARGGDATAWGGSNVASGAASTSFGVLNTSSGHFSTTWGKNNVASHTYATSWGLRNNATRSASTAWGDTNEATGDYSTVWGRDNRARHKLSSVWGEENSATGAGVTVWGKGNIGKSYMETMIGTYADTLVTADDGQWDLDNYLFVIGNGTSDMDRNNALTLLKSGKVGLGTSIIAADEDIIHANGAKLTTSGIWMNASDVSRKTAINEVPYGLESVMSLRPVAYIIKDTGSRNVGFIAQEVKKIVPEVISGKSGNMAMSYGQLTAVLTKAIQEQQAMINAQSGLIKKLESRIEQLENRQ